MSERCKVEVYDHHTWRNRRCSNNATRDGYCGVHHPDNVKKRRAKQAVKYEAERRRSASYRLERASERVNMLEQALRDCDTATMYTGSAEEIAAIVAKALPEEA